MTQNKPMGDAAIAVALGLVFFFLYAHFGLRLAQGIYFDYLNLGFDFDPPYFIDFLVGQRPEGINYKHPLSILFRPFASLFLALGYSPKAAAALVMALFGGLTVALVYGFCRIVRFGRPEAAAATVFFGSSATPLFTAMIVESYGWANFSIVVVWFIFALGIHQPPVPLATRLAAAVLAAGVTITNVLHAIVAEFFGVIRTCRFRQTLTQTFIFGLYTALVLLIVLAILQHHALWNVVTHPVQTAKEIYWLRTHGPTTGMTEVLLSFFGYSFFSPAFTNVEIAPAIIMVDFRTFSFSRAESIALFAWWIFLLLGSVAGFINIHFRKVALPLLAVVLLNVLFHLDYQYRGSLFIYAAHLHFPIFALGMGAAPLITSMNWRIRVGYITVLLIFASAALAINLQRACEFAGMFDTLLYPPDAPAISR